MDKQVDRIEWIDIMKGIGIIFVVIGHSWLAFTVPYMFKTVYLFHMPLFFFISGYLYNKSNIKKFTNKKAQQLLVPYCTLAILFFPIAAFIFPDFGNIFNSGSVIDDIVRYCLGRNLMNRITGTLWFLTCLFFTQIIYNFIQNKYKDKTINIIVLAFLIISYFTSYYNNVYNPYKFWLPFSLHLIFATIPIFHIGYLSKKHNLKINTYIFMIAITITIISIKFVNNNVYNIYGCFYGIPLFTLFCSLTLILLIKKISIFISKYQKFSNILIYLGKASLTIMAFHLTFIAWMSKYISNSIALIILSIILSIIIYELFNRFSITRALFLGNIQDITSLKNKFVNKNNIKYR